MMKKLMPICVMAALALVSCRQQPNRCCGFYQGDTGLLVMWDTEERELSPSPFTLMHREFFDPVDLKPDTLYGSGMHLPDDDYTRFIDYFRFHIPPSRDRGYRHGAGYDEDTASQRRIPGMKVPDWHHGDTDI